MADQPREEINATQPFRRFWRIVLSNPPDAWDFASHEAKGIPIRNNDPETLRIHDGISVFDQRRYARRMAIRAPALGRFLAEIQVPMNAPIRAERTTRSHGHYTLWGDPEFLLGCVAAVTPASEEPD